MNKSFSFNRFGKYLRYDIVNAWQKSGVSVVATAAMPLLFYVIQQLFSLVFSGHFTPASQGATVAAYILSFILTVVFFPAWNYGMLTNKKSGSDWLLVPASGLEKFISMLLVTCVAVPLVWLGVIVSSDALVTLLSASGDGMGIKVIFGTMSKALAEFHSENVSIGIGGPWATYLSWCGNILTFTLGAIFFRKNKIVLTILSVIGICILLVVAGGIVFGGEMHFEPADINEDSLMRLLNCVIYGLYFVEFTLLNLGIYFRIKTLKH